MVDVTRYMDLALKPIPNRWMIPKSSVAYLGVLPDTDCGSAYLIWIDGQEVIIEGPPLEDPTKPIDGQYERLIWTMKMHNKNLPVIEDLLPVTDLRITQRARFKLVTDSYGDYQLVHSQEPERLHQVSCPTWAPIIPITDIEFTVWDTCTIIGLSQRRGVWNGKAVDVLYATDDLGSWGLNCAMYGLRHCAGLDLTFEVYGHLVDEDGRIVGLVSEPAFGRMIKLSDRVLVTEVLDLLESNRCLYYSCGTSRFMICEGKLRLIDLGSLVIYDDAEKLKRDAEIFHKAEMDYLFQEFKDYGLFGYFRLPPDYLINSHEKLRYLRLMPIPHYPLHQYRISIPGYILRTRPLAATRSDHFINYKNDDDEPLSAAYLVSRKPRRTGIYLIHRNRNAKVYDHGRHRDGNGALASGTTPSSSWRRIASLPTRPQSTGIHHR